MTARAVRLHWRAARRLFACGVPVFIFETMRSLPNSSTPIALLTIVITACSSATGGAGAPAASPAPTAQPNPAAVAQAREDSLRHPYTEADVQFMYNMIGHHAQAVVMSNWAP